MSRATWLAPLAAALSLALASAPSVAAGPKAKREAPEHFHFSAIPWSIPADSAARLLEARGYRPLDERHPEYRAFQGRLFERLAVVHAFADEQGRVVRWQIGIAPETMENEYADAYSAVRRLYEEVRVETRNRYGREHDEIEKFRFPFEKGDGREADALREKKATIETRKIEDGDRLTVGIDESLSVVLTYESPAWTALELRRREKKASDL